MKKVKANAVFVFLVGVFCLTSHYSTRAEVIDVHNEEKVFGEWKVFCEVDAMMDISHCRIGSKFYQNTAVITIEPGTKFLQQLLLVIPQIKVGSFVKLRVDKNDIIISKNITTKDFGMIPLDNEQKNVLFRQMKNGEFLFLRFDTRDSEKEITARMNLKDFRNALSYHNSRASK